MGIELVVLDMAGTTVYDGDAVHRSLQETLAAASVHVTRDEVNAVMGQPKPVAIETLLRRKGAPEAGLAERTAALHSDFVDRMIRYYRDHAQEIAPASAVFQELRARGVKVFLDTGFGRPIADAILARLAWTTPEVLDGTVTSDEVARGRPHPDMVLRAMDLCAITDPRRVAKVGDTPSDLQEGHAAGCGLVIGVTEGSHTKAELEPEPHTHLIPNVGALPALVLGAAVPR